MLLSIFRDAHALWGRSGTADEAWKLAGRSDGQSRLGHPDFLQAICGIIGTCCKV